MRNYLALLVATFIGSIYAFAPLPSTPLLSTTSIAATNSPIDAESSSLSRRNFVANLALVAPTLLTSQVAFAAPKKKKKKSSSKKAASMAAPTKKKKKKGGKSKKAAAAPTKKAGKSKKKKGAPTSTKKKGKGKKSKN
mmetsp:Transcript_30753/g.35068  ORF Transcript_30753/g.35068 Transcript_30753/m.35068 type:complete len:138 (-) Transcript_30753:448-861(-)|eukprot:CAMPEP_0194140120 /NCGR_PEP_ID=MMETSP0152-20130528/9719_1 /TAXON_ID=1049557 /ORGANISM="Thalassiothrix antarctica, Strain L6-D1" /LENGTH=137 /DNA_ID=CAMNT_0038838251 /DNA_START=126 /DNA_END=539 /DNA_ORIENTATION=-